MSSASTGDLCMSTRMVFAELGMEGTKGRRKVFSLCGLETSTSSPSIEQVMMALRGWVPIWWFVQDSGAEGASLALGTLGEISM
jgi:hypothetical protein